MEDYEYNHMTSNRDVYPILKENAKGNRQNPTEAELILWECIRNRRVGVKFRRQHPVLDFIADFFCIEKNLIIEVDGDYHQSEEQTEHDNQRSDRLYERGYYVLRFKNEDIINNTQEVLERIKEIINKI